MEFIADAIEWVTGQALIIFAITTPVIACLGFDPVKVLITPQMVAAIAATYIFVSFEKFCYQFNNSNSVEEVYDE